MASSDNEIVLYEQGDIAIWRSSHNRYIEMDLSHVELPEHTQGFFKFAFALGFVGFADSVDQLHEHRGLPPVDYESMNAAYYHVTLQKYLEWHSTSKTMEEKRESLRKAFNQAFGYKAAPYWEKKKAKFPHLDCEGLPMDSDEDHGGYYVLMRAVDEGPEDPDYAEAKETLAAIDPDGSIIRHLRTKPRWKWTISQAETIVVIRRRAKRREMAKLAAETKAKSAINKKRKEKLRTEKQQKMKKAKLEAENDADGGEDTMDVDEPMAIDDDNDDENHNDAEDHNDDQDHFDEDHYDEENYYDDEDQNRMQDETDDIGDDIAGNQVSFELPIRGMFK